MSSAASPLQPIGVAQNTAHAQRLLAAQSRLYTDAKRIHDVRVLSVIALACVTISIALFVPSARVFVGTIGGAIAFLWSILGSGREKRCRKDAAFVQEVFDTYVFDLPWKDIAADRPSPTLIAEASARYRGNRTKNWYPDTSNVARPLDILICQRSNLGWGASMHRYYASILTVGLVLLIVVGVVASLLANLSTADALAVVVVPLLGPVREIVEMIRANRDSGDLKSKTEAKVLVLWDRGMKHPGGVTIMDCRDVQDRILAIRQTNAHIPDWLDNLRRKRHETAMQTSAHHLVEEAVRHGRTVDQT